jgi:hypothetical protein
MSRPVTCSSPRVLRRYLVVVTSELKRGLCLALMKSDAPRLARDVEKVEPSLIWDRVGCSRHLSTTSLTFGYELFCPLLELWGDMGLAHELDDRQKIRELGKSDMTRSDTSLNARPAAMAPMMTTGMRTYTPGASILRGKDQEDVGASGCQVRHITPDRADIYFGK